MRKTASWLTTVWLLLLPATLPAQYLTPHIGLQVPLYNQSNWQVPIDYDLNRLDLLLSGLIPIPSLNPSTILLLSEPYANLPACTTATEGMIGAVSDSTTNTWYAVISGGGTYYAWAYCNGTNWTVAPFGGSNPGFFVNPMTTEDDTIYQHSGIPARLPIGASGTCIVSNGTDPVWSSCAGTVSTAWSSLTSPVANTTLSMGTYTTKFNFPLTANLNGFTFANTTAATSSTTLGSPAFAFDSSYWTGTASSVDEWTIGSVMDSGTNGNSTFYICMNPAAHSGGNHFVEVPGLIDLSTTQYGVIYGGGLYAPEGSTGTGTVGQALISGGSSAPPSWQTPNPGVVLAADSPGLTAGGIVGTYPIIGAGRHAFRVSLQAFVASATSASTAGMYVSWTQNSVTVTSPTISVSATTGNAANSASVYVYADTSSSINPTFTFSSGGGSDSYDAHVIIEQL